MTKTQALQRLYKALTGEEGRNTGSKIIEDLAIAAENGEIGGGGGGKVATVTFSYVEHYAGPKVEVNMPIIVESEGLNVVDIQSAVPIPTEGESFRVPVVEDGTIIEPYSNPEYVSISGDVSLFDETVPSYLVTGDATFTLLHLE